MNIGWLYDGGTELENFVIKMRVKGVIDYVQRELIRRPVRTNGSAIGFNKHLFNGVWADENRGPIKCPTNPTKSERRAYHLAIYLQYGAKARGCLEIAMKKSDKLKKLYTEGMTKSFF